MSTFVISASFVCRTMPFGTVFVPSTLSSSSGSVGAMTSITFFSSASVAPRFEAWRTASLSPGRVPVVGLRELAQGCGGVVDHLAPQVGLDVPPPTSIGVEEPMFVCGAIASRSAAWLIQTPARLHEIRAERRRRSPAPSMRARPSRSCSSTC
jgi:hypothetical protein